MATTKTETSTGQSQADYEQAKLERRKKLIEQYHKTLLQISTTPLQPKSEKCTFNDIYIRPKITREIKGEKGETEEVEVKTMSEIFTKDGVSQKSIYVLGDAGSGKTSFCKYLVNCWCLAHSEEHEADNEKHGGVNEIEGDSEKRGRDNDEDENHGGSFCKYLANCSCFSHSEEHEADNGNEDGSSKPEGDIQDNSDGLIHSESHNDDSGGILTDFEFDINYELKFNGVKEMKKFDFVFYIPLRQYQNIDTIDEMLQKRYQMKILNTRLEEESSRVMILLDSLDEWSSENIPEHSIFKEYTIVTTSRPWTFHTLRLSDVKIEQSLNLKGFDLICEREMVNRTVSQLNVRRHANKRARDCMEELKEESLKSLKQVPIMLQHLICLWFGGKLDKTSRCTIYTGMLELFFTWNDMKTTGTSTRLMKGTKKVNLPQYLADKTKLGLNRHFIYEVSQLAYETLFNCPKDKSLTFDICMFDELEISDEVRENCLKLGIITEDECPSLSVSEPQSAFLSFIHKSIQEFLAAVNIVINFNSKFGLSDSTGNIEFAEKFICKIFQKCSIVNDIFEQSNVIIMLCGLEPRLATHVSKYIYDAVSKDSCVHEYRRTISQDIYNNISRDHDCITDIQKLMFDSMKEFNATGSVGINPVFYIGDLVFDIFNRYCDIACLSIDQHQIVPDFVQSIKVHHINTQNVTFTKYLSMFHHLEKIEISHRVWGHTSKQEINEIYNCVSETFKVNTLTLKSLSLSFDSDYSLGGVSNYDKYYPVYKAVVSNLPSMINLVAISMSFITMSHDDTTTFCNFLNRTIHLEQICLHEVKCQCEKQHNVNLSKHQKLQNLYLKYAVCVKAADTTNLEIFTCSTLSNSNYEKIFDIIKISYKLKELELYVDYYNKSQSYHTNITKRLVTVLPLLHNLSELELWWCRLTDNIIQLPLEMRSLKNIRLDEVIINLTSWQKFVDSLPGIPHTVVVSVEYCYIADDGKECNDDISALTSQGFIGGRGNDAKQYAKDRDQLFHVKYDHKSVFKFSTKK